MKRTLSLAMAVAVLVLLGSTIQDEAFAQTSGKQFGKSAMLQHGPFDTDGDGIPNGQDPDYVKPQDASGNKFGNANSGSKMNGLGKGNGYGPGDGSGHQGIGPRDGTGFGPGSGSGNCDGTGPKGRQGRGK